MAIYVLSHFADERRRLSTLLGEGGFDRVVVGEKATDLFDTLDTTPEPGEAGIDLVLLGLRLPDLNGIEICRRLKASDQWRDIPVIIVTSRTSEQDLQAAFDAGAADYIVRPFRAPELLARVRAALRLKREMDDRKVREAELLQLTHQLEAANRDLRAREQELLELTRRLEHLSSLDGLTGIANRRQFDRMLDQAWRRAIRYESPLSLAMVDIDCFKAYNDTYGHQSGDDCLKQVAKILSKSVRRPDDRVARYGGEEFAIILPDTDAEGALVVAELIRSRLAEEAIPHASSPVSPVVTASIGIATASPRLGIEPCRLVACADRALYRAKQAGRDRTWSWDPALLAVR